MNSNKSLILALIFIFAAVNLSNGQYFSPHEGFSYI